MSTDNSDASTASPHSTEQLVALGRSLLAELDRTRPPDGQSQAMVKVDRMANAAHFPTVHGLSIHAVRVGKVALNLFESGLNLEAMPLARTAFECALTAAWAADSDEATAALLNRGRRQKELLAETMAKSALSVFQEGAARFDPDLEPIETTAMGPANSFEKLCDELEPARDQAYVLYRAMSWSCHPSAYVVDQYLEEGEETPETPLGVRLLGEPKEAEVEHWVHLTVASMMWAVRARDVMVTPQLHRSFLRRLARELGVAEVLRLSPQARERERRAEQERRRAGWKGAKSRSSTSDPSDATRREG